jgi:hypothetical protein
VLSSWLSKPFTIEARDIPDPELADPGDVIVRIRYAGICGSDLWSYRGLVSRPEGQIGHEFLGEVVAAGPDVTTVRPGDAVIAPFLFAEGSCEECRRGLPTLCERSGIWGRNGMGAQAEAIRVPYADAVLVPLPWAPGDIDDDLGRTLLPLCDVFATGTHGAVLAGVSAGDTVAVVGDGAVGISAAVAARRLGAERVVLLGDQPARLAVAAGLGVETMQVSRDASPKAALRALLGGRLPGRVVECVGLQGAWDTAFDVVAPAGAIGFVGLPHGVDPIPPSRIFDRQVQVCGGPAPARTYLPDLLAAVRAGELDPSPLINQVIDLGDVRSGYEAMHTGAALKVLLRCS